MHLLILCNKLSFSLQNIRKLWKRRSQRDANIFPKDSYNQLHYIHNHVHNNIESRNFLLIVRIQLYND
jgi:hypothetical protein